MVMRRPTDPTQHLGLGLRELSELAEVVGGPGTRVKDAALFQRTLTEADRRLQGERAATGNRVAETRRMEAPVAETGAAMTAANAQSMTAPDVQYEHGVPFGTSTISVPRIDPKSAALSHEERLIEVQRLQASGVPEMVAVKMVFPPHQEEGGRPTIQAVPAHLLQSTDPSALEEGRRQVQGGVLERAVHGTDPVELERTRRRVAKTYKVLGTGALLAATLPVAATGGLAAGVGLGARAIAPRVGGAILRHAPRFISQMTRGEIARRGAEAAGAPGPVQFGADVAAGGGLPRVPVQGIVASTKSGVGGVAGKAFQAVKDWQPWTAATKIEVDTVRASRAAIVAKNLEARDAAGPAIDKIRSYIRNTPAEARKIQELQTEAMARGIAKAEGMVESNIKQFGRALPEESISGTYRAGLAGTGAKVGTGWAPIAESIAERQGRTGIRGPVLFGEGAGPYPGEVVADFGKSYLGYKGMAGKLVQPGTKEAAIMFQRVLPTEAAIELGITGRDLNKMYKMITERFTDVARLSKKGTTLKDLTRSKPSSRQFQRNDAYDALTRVLTGFVPTRRELGLLEEVFGSGFANDVQRYKGWLRKTIDTVVDAGFLLPKAIRSSYDFSAVLRQAVIYSANPFHIKQTGGALYSMFRVGFGRNPRQFAVDVYDDIVDWRLNPHADRLYGRAPETAGRITTQVQDIAEETGKKIAAKLEIIDPRKGRVAFTNKEEHYASTLAERMPEFGRDVKNIFGKTGLKVKGVGVPQIATPTAARVGLRVITLPIRLLGKGVERSELMYATFLNQMRDGVARKTLTGWDEVAEQGGRKLEQKEINSLINTVNIATGRGATARKGDYNKALSAAFWAPRFVASRVQAPVIGAVGAGEAAIDFVRWTLGKEATGNRARKQLARDLVAFVGTTTGMLGALRGFGVIDEVELDPRSSDFGKGRIGNTRFDFWGGFQPIVRYTTQFITRQRKTIETKEIAGVHPGKTLYRFLWSKSAPGGASAFANRAMRETFMGEDLAAPVSLMGQDIGPTVTAEQRELIEQWIPLFALDVVDAIEEEGLTRAISFMVPSAAGYGTQTFVGSREKDVRRILEIMPNLTKAQAESLSRKQGLKQTIR